MANDPLSHVPPIVTRITALIDRQRLLVRGDKVIVAVSGGADSLALLHLLKAIDLHLELFAVYVDHGLRPMETPAEKALVENSCHLLGIPFLTRTVDVQGFAAEEKRSLEDAARILRYEVLEQVRLEQGARVIAVGHTADDQAEEFFIRLIRGSSLNGLSGMKFRRDLIIRPLLLETKASLSAHLAALGVSWCQDSSNLQRKFLRNRIRLDLLPLLERDFNPAIRDTVLHTMSILKEEDHYLNSQAQEAFNRCVSSDLSKKYSLEGAELIIDLDGFEKIHPAIRRRVMEICFHRMSIRPTYRLICTMVDFAEKGKNGGEIHLEDGVRLEKRYKQMLLRRPLANGRTRGSAAVSKGICLSIPCPGSYFVPEAGRTLILEMMPLTENSRDSETTLFLALERLSFPLLLRTCRPGEVFHPCNGRGRKKISRYFNEKKIPAKERSMWPVLLSQSAVVALPGLQIDHHYRTTEPHAAVLAVKWVKKPG